MDCLIFTGTAVSPVLYSRLKKWDADERGWTLIFSLRPPRPLR
jgi:hypothetical protein